MSDILNQAAIVAIEAALGTTMRDLADAAGVNQSTVTRWKTGEIKVSADKALRLAEDLKDRATALQKAAYRLEAIAEQERGQA